MTIQLMSREVTAMRFYFKIDGEVRQIELQASLGRVDVDAECEAADIPEKEWPVVWAAYTASGMFG